MYGENCLIFNWHSSRVAPEMSVFRVPTKGDEYSTNGRNNIVAVITRDMVKIKNRTFWVELSSRKKWSVISNLFLLNYIYHYISKWSTVLELYRTSFFSMKSWRVKFRNFLGDLPVCYAALFTKRTINNIYMTFLMALHQTHDRFWYSF